MTGRLGYIPSRYLDAPPLTAEQESQLRALMGLHITPVTAKATVSRSLRRRTPVRRAA